MSRWVDVRVPRDDGTRALEVLVNELSPLNFRYDGQPFAAGPEVEISVQTHTEPRVVEVLERRGVEVLASRTRLAQPLEIPEARS